MLNNKNDEPLGMYDCHETGGNQFFVFTKNGEIITIWDKCVGVNKQLRLVKEKCTDRKSQMWKYDNEVIKGNEMNFNVKIRILFYFGRTSG